MSPDDLDTLAERMFWPATKLVAAVHDGDRDRCHAALAGLSLLDLRAMCVVLAALVPDDQTLTVLADLMAAPAPEVSERQAARHRAELEAALKRGRTAA